MITFDTDEHVIVEVRKHWWVLIPYIFIALFAFFAPLVIYSGISVLPVRFLTTGSFPALLAFIYFGILLFTWILLFYWWTDYYLDVWIITNKKIMAVEQSGFFGREVKTLSHAKVQDIESEVHGINATFFGFGDIMVQTASSEGAFEIHKVKNPNEVRSKLNEIISEYQKTHSGV